ncbi:hypothetical protein GALL_505350 [mine drainage metagenome]|uniref:Uncharacterized protein n=1 Tax=mine drainage metagenome TaxID=410659 RepID=A0A1J5PJZ5_9ZZZZ
MLPHIRCDVSIHILGHVPQGLNHILGLDDVIGSVVILQTITAAPAFNRVPPCTQRIGIGLGGTFLDHGDQFRQHILDIANNRNVHLDPFGYARRIDVNVNDLALILGKMLGVTNHPVIKPGSDSQQHIAVLHGIIGFQRSGHAQHSQKLAITPRKSTQPHQSVGTRASKHVDQLAQLV